MRKYKNIVIILVVLMMIPIQAYAMISTTVYYEATEYALVFKNTSNAVTTVSVHFVGTQITYDRIKYQDGAYGVNTVGVIGTDQTISLGPGQIYGIDNINNGYARIEWDDTKVEAETSTDLQTFIDLNPIQEYHTYQKWANYPVSPTSMEEAPQQMIWKNANGQIVLSCARANAGDYYYMLNQNINHPYRKALYIYNPSNNSWDTWIEGGNLQLYQSNPANIYESNTNIYTDINKTSIFKAATTTNLDYISTGGGGTGTVTEGTLPTVTFVSPEDYFADNVNVIAINVRYTVPKSTYPDPAKLTSYVTGGVPNTVEWDFNDLYDKGTYYEGLARFTLIVNPGENTIKFAEKYDGNVIKDNVLHVIYYEDFIDADNDGRDDRTGQTYYEPYVPPTNTPETTAGDFITNAINTMKTWVTSSTSWINNVSGFIGVIYGFLPVEFRGGIIVIFSTAVIFTILKIIRG